MKDMWNERYAAEEYIYGTEPNAFFAAQLAGVTPGRLLLPADGEGRNAVYAAARGWQVDAFDLSTVGRDKALALAARRAVGISYDVADLADMPHIEAAYDAVGLFFVHTPPALRADLHARCIRALRPGGLLLLEAFTPAQLERSSGGPKSPELLYNLDMLREDFSALRLDVAEYIDTVLDEGDFHRGPAAVVRIAGRRAGGKA